MTTSTQEKPTDIWKRADVTAAYQQSRKGIPFADDHFEVTHRVLDAHGLIVERLLDLGCGDGIATSRMADRGTLREATLVDFSEPMLAMARENVEQIAQVQTEVIEADLGDAAWVDRIELGKGYDLVISRFAIHHLPDERKRDLYGEIQGLLREGGVFVNIEHVKSASPKFQAAFDTHLVEGIHAADIQGMTLEEVEAAYHARFDAEVNILSPVEDQLAWLRDLGFADVDCHFKCFELAVFSGRKAGTTEG